MPGAQPWRGSGRNGGGGARDGARGFGVRKAEDEGAFTALDADNSGFIDTEELIAYYVSQARVHMIVSHPCFQSCSEALIRVAAFICIQGLLVLSYVSQGVERDSVSELLMLLDTNRDKRSEPPNR